MPRIAQIATDQATAEDDQGNFMAEVAEAAEVKEEEARDAAESLGRFLSGQTLGNGTEVMLRWTPGGLLRASAGSGVEETYSSSELCQVWLERQKPPYLLMPLSPCSICSALPCRLPPAR